MSMGQNGADMNDKQISRSGILTVENDGRNHVVTSYALRNATE